MKTQDELNQFINENKNSLLDIETLKREFQDKLSTKVNKREFINSELELVKEKASKPQRQNGLKGFYSIMAEKESLYCQSYENYLHNNEELDFTTRELSKYELIKELNGVTWAKYQLYLTNALNTKKESKQKTFTHLKQLGVLYYLGLTNKIDNTSKIAELIAPLIDREKESTRQKLGSLQYDLKDRVLLKEIKQYFLELGLTEHAKTVENDINRLN